MEVVDVQSILVSFLRVGSGFPLLIDLYQLGHVAFGSNALSAAGAVVSAVFSVPFSRLGDGNEGLYSGS